MKYFLLFIFLLLIKINTLENIQNIPKNNYLKDSKDSLTVYDKLNHFETISFKQDFIINTSSKSIAYFDSLDKNTIIYISKNYDDYASSKDERITGKFYEIEPNINYYIRTFVYTFYSVFKKYVYPLELDKSEININDDIEEINYLYLEKNKSYTLNFEDNKIKKMIKLSHKTLKSKVKIIIDESQISELSENSLYYQIQENFKGKIILLVEENDAFIEFLSDIGDYKVLTDISYENEVDSNIILIKIPKTQKIFELSLTSDNPFKFSLSYGFSILTNYYYYSKFNTKIAADINENKYSRTISLVGAFKNINVLEGEFLSFAIILESSANQKIYLNYYQHSRIDKLYDEEMSEENCTKIIDNLKDILDLYVYYDIAKNPPEISGYPNYHHKPVDLKGELDKVSKVNRKFYEFYQEIQKILTSTKDLHLNIYAHQTPKGIQFGQYSTVIPFNFEVRKSDNGQYKIFITKNQYYDLLFPDQMQFFDRRLEIPLKAINDMDPFDYIQNWSEYRQTKNPHAQFSNIINQIPYFYLCYFPVEYSDLFIEYEFEDNSSIRLWRFDNFERVKESDVEFNDYFLKVFKSKESPFSLPHISIIKDKFLIFKGLKKEENILKNENGNIKWDILYEETNNKYLKCRFDEENKVNVWIQNTFSLDFFKASEKALDCSRLFHSNEYPIIIIQDHNGGGSAQLRLLMSQILQVKTSDRNYEAFIYNDRAKNIFNAVNWEFVEVETCKKGTSFNDSMEIIDHYNYNNVNIEHKRTKVIDTFPSDYRNALNNFREEYFDSKYSKRPTDIIIFTDSYSYSATSGFIRDFQNNGGAIVVGYYGNPKINGTDFFDSSQSHSGVRNFEETEMYKNLNSVGFTIIGVTFEEIYDDNYQNDSPIPREYTIAPVDYRVDIYSRYSDDLYEKFIKEGLEIHNLFNNGSYCNSKNDRLLLHDEKCKIFEEDEYAHGGYKCNDQNKWDKEKCEKYYCDIGYYYDHVTNECKKECPFDENRKVIFIHEKQKSKIIKIGFEKTYKIITLYNENYYYSFSTTEETIGGQLPKLFFMNANHNININNGNEKDLEITIKPISPDLNPNIYFMIYRVVDINKKEIFFTNEKKMYFIQSLKDSVFYIDNELHSSKGSIKIAKYNEGIELEDIIKISDNYFSDVLGKIFTLEKNQLYIIYHDFREYEQLYFCFEPKPTENIQILYSDINIYYLEKNKKYVLDFSTIGGTDKILKLSRKTINSEINLIDENIKLNSNNLYYYIKNSSTSTLNLEVGNESALIEILFKEDDNNIEIIDLQGKNEFHLNKQYNFIEIPKKYTSKIITFNLNKYGNSIISLYHDYSIPGYSRAYSLDENNNGIILSNFTFNITEHYKSNIKLMENEYYYLIIQTTKNDLNIKVDIEIYEGKEDDNEEEENDNGEGDKDNKGNKNKKGLETWHILLIVGGSFIALLQIVIIILLCRLLNKKDTSKELEDKVQNLTEIKV